MYISFYACERTTPDTYVFLYVINDGVALIGPILTSGGPVVGPRNWQIKHQHVCNCCHEMGIGGNGQTSAGEGEWAQKINKNNTK